MEKALIVEAWSKYRPTSLENTPREDNNYNSIHAR
jgi:hypothetical protein